MGVRSQFVQRLLPFGLVLGFLVSIAQLGAETRGPQSFVVVSFAAVMVALKLASGIRSTIKSFGVLGLLILLGIAVITLTSSIPMNTASGLVWGCLILSVLAITSVAKVAISGTQTGSQFESISGEELVAQGDSEAAETFPVATFSIEEEKHEFESSVADLVEFIERPASQIALFSGLLSEDEDEEFDLEDEEFEEDESGNGRVVHSLTRIRQSDEERLEGTMNVEFESGQKHVYLHVPFSPGFMARPTAMCICECDDMFAAEFDILHTYGGRLSVRRRGDFSFPAEMSVSIVITAPLVTRRVA
ncbi:hypothetical protein [Planctomicrobium sp. SH527]|uniref:hypothetical protein n=1 Tax=Planctomicrobium sp. SH527 TaxID=3448123 RepID=UPI003F5B99F1